MNRTGFKFQGLEIWTEAVEMGDLLFDMADALEQKKLSRFAEQMRGAGMSISNNIAEGPGSSSTPEFRQFLNIARRSTFETANILVILKRRKLMDEGTLDNYLERLDKIYRKITDFQISLGSAASKAGEEVS